MVGKTRSHPVALASLSAVAAATTLVSLLTWQTFTQDFGLTLGPLFIIAVAIAGTGAVGRWWRVPRGLLVLAQLVIAAALVSVFVCGSPIPIGDSWDKLQTAFQDAVQSANRFAPPVPAEEPPVHPLLIAGGAGCLLLVDFFACTLRRVPLAGLPLLTIYSVPVSMTGDGPHWLLYTITAIGFLTMIFLSESEQVARWGPILVEDHGHSDPKPISVPAWPRTGARAIGGVATALSIVVPLLLPTFSVHLFNFGPGTGGNDDINIQNPMIDLKRDLVRGADIPLVTVHTDDPDPSYLRIAVLNRFSDNEWSSGDREVPSSQEADGSMPGLVGVSAQLPRHQFDYTLDASRDFRSTWLPTTSMVTRVEAPGDWRYDTTTMDFLASSDDLDTSQLHWSLQGVKLEYDVNRLADAPPAGPLVNREFTQIPTGLDPIVRDLTTQITSGASTRFEKAVALQDWFRDPAKGGFTYSTDVSLSNGTDDLVRFLTQGDGGRTGYCEQFAAAMAVMARELGIPARVAVGFLRPDKVGGDTYVYSSHDLHAWPELFFSGSGWVRFEPTPAGGAEGVATDAPAYTTALPIDIGNATTAPSDSASEVDPGLARDSNEAQPTGAENAKGKNSSNDGGFPWAWLSGAVALLLLVVLVALAPRTIRRRRRDQRGLLGPEEAWQELRDTAIDLRLAWPQQRSPWQTREALVQLFGAPRDEYTPDRPRRGADTNPDAVFALDRIVHSLERLRYARPTGEEAGTWRAEMQTCVEALYGGAPKRARRAADWWPRSVFSRQVDVRRPFDDGPLEPAMAGRVVDHVG
jgi:transglutaminase-like putative cysteine protease